MGLISLAQLKRHLRILHDDEDDELQDLADNASAVVVDYLKKPEGTWTEATDQTPSDAPGVVKTAVLLQAGDLYEHRGDEDHKMAPADGYLIPPVTRLLHRMRDPAYA